MAVGKGDLHFGNDFYLASGKYTVTVSVGQEAATFTDVAVGTAGAGQERTGSAPPPAGGTAGTTTSVQIAGVGGAAANGTATPTLSGTTLQVSVRLSGLAPGSTSPEHIHSGTCASSGGILYPLPDLRADAAGNATATATFEGVSAIPTAGWALMVHAGPTLASGGKPIACGDVAPAGSTTSGTTKLPNTGSSQWPEWSGLLLLLAGLALLLASRRTRRVH